MAIARDEPGAAGEGPMAAFVDVKAVPGAKRDAVAGRLGQRLKVRTAQPPEGGRANRAICELLAIELGVKPSAVTVHRGQSSPEKTIRIAGVTAAQVESKWPA